MSLRLLEFYRFIEHLEFTKLSHD